MAQAVDMPSANPAMDHREIERYPLEAFVQYLALRQAVFLVNRRVFSLRIFLLSGFVLLLLPNFRNGKRGVSNVAIFHFL
jgi:hypothetical protein